MMKHVCMFLWREHNGFGVWVGGNVGGEMITQRAFHHTRLPTNIFICDILNFGKVPKARENMVKVSFFFLLSFSFDHGRFCCDLSFNKMLAVCKTGNAH